MRTLRPGVVMKNVATICGIGTATPPGVAQAQTAQLAAAIARGTPQQEGRLERIFLRSGIDSRGSVLVKENEDKLAALQAFYPMPDDDEDRGPTTAARMARYAAEAPPLIHAAAIRSLDHAEVRAKEITHLITVSCTGFFAPGLDSCLVASLGLSRGVRRVHVGFMGCHAAFNAMAAARDAVLADRSAKVLVCCVELCSLHFAYGWDMGKVVANALFADGAAAAVVATEQRVEGLWHLRDTSSFLMPDSLEAMTWHIGDHGFEMTLSPAVPAGIREHLRPWCQSWLGKHGMEIDEVASWAIHPGGPKILSAVADALELPSEALRPSRDILARHGNMSSATILFILREMMGREFKTPCVAIGLGPGLMAEGMLFV
jgi:predicted naringenin-chalcone synthase